MNIRCTQLHAFSDQRYWNVQQEGSRISHLVRIYVTEDGKKKPRIEVSFVFTCNLCLLLLSVEQLLICVFFSGPALILCLTVASGWNKERCAPEIELIITLPQNSQLCLTVYCKQSVTLWVTLRFFLFRSFTYVVFPTFVCRYLLLLLELFVHWF